MVAREEPLLLNSFCSNLHCIGCFPASRCRPARGGFVRLIRPVSRCPYLRPAAGNERVSAADRRRRAEDDPKESPPPRPRLPPPRICSADDSNAGVFSVSVTGTQSAPRPRPRRRSHARNLAHALAAGGDDAALQDGRERRTRAGYPRRRRDHFQSCQRPGPLGGERAGQTLDRQHHQGDDDGGVSGRQPRPDPGRHRRAQRRLRRVDDVSEGQRSADARRRAAPRPDRVRQRRPPACWRACRTAAPPPSSSG